MNPRLAEEWVDLRKVYRDAKHNASPERVEVTVQLEDGQYSEARCAVAVLIPAGYRVTGPDNFLVPSSVRFVDGTQLPGGEATGIGMPGWWLVSFHFLDAQGASTWNPTADPRRGDNLVGYLMAVESFLARRCN